MNRINSRDYKAALGIDPGLAATGFAVVQTGHSGGRLCEFGSLKTRSGTPLPVRLAEIHDGVIRLIEKWQPALVVMEDVYVLDKYPKAAIQLGEVIGVIMLAVQSHSLETVMIRPTEVKSCLAGNGRASKEHVSSAVRRLLRVKSEIKPDHASDAAALAVVALSRKGYYHF